MNTELARDLQYRITKEALAMLVIHGSAAETKDYERAMDDQHGQRLFGDPIL